MKPGAQVLGSYSAAAGAASSRTAQAAGGHGGEHLAAAQAFVQNYSPARGEHCWWLARVVLEQMLAGTRAQPLDLRPELREHWALKSHRRQTLHLCTGHRQGSIGDSLGEH